mmetsp:Transcript_14611/g.14237  ORF Transcript_14611/g.14237 Transcript_14611/m.14237 type:complete len:471 (-) Transcript_14611:20-1432(-)
MLTALVYCELSTKMSRTPGSSYGYIYSSFGELPAWIIGWNLNLRYGVCAAALARGWAAYVVGIFGSLGVALPVWLYELEHFGIYGSPLSVFFIVACTYISTLGSEESNTFNIVFTLSKLVSLVIIILVGFYYFEFINYQPFFVEEHGFRGTIYGATVVFFAYLGFDMITTLSEEAKNPKRDMPKSITSSVFICMTVYVFIAITLCGMAEVQTLVPEIALPMAFDMVGNKSMAIIIYLCGFFGLTASAFSGIISQQRVLYAFSNDGIFFPIFKELDPVTKVPKKGAWIACFFISVVCYFLDLETITLVVSLGNLISYSFVNTAVIALRFRSPFNFTTHIKPSPNEKYPWIYLVLAFLFAMSIGLMWNEWLQIIFGTFAIFMVLFMSILKQQSIPTDSFVCPWVPLTPCLAIMANFYLTSILDAYTWFYFIAYEMMGISFYFGYGFHYSRLNKYHRQMEESFRFSLSSISNK